MIDSLKFGELMERQRLFFGWTQRELARRLGRSTATISSIENGHRLPGAKLIPLIAAELRIDRRRIVAAKMRRNGDGDDCREESAEEA